MSKTGRRTQRRLLKKQNAPTPTNGSLLWVVLVVVVLLPIALNVFIKNRETIHAQALPEDQLPVAPADKILLTTGGIPPGMSSQQAMDMWSQRAQASFDKNPYPWVREDLTRLIMDKRIGITFGSEVDSGNVIASVRLRQREFGVVPTIKLQTSVLNVPVMPQQMDEALVHEGAGHLRELLFNQRPPEAFDTENQGPSELRAFHIAESELYAYWIEAEYCEEYSAGCLGEGPINAYRHGGLAGMVDFMEHDFVYFAPWLNDYCSATDQAFAGFRARHIRP